MAQSEPAMPTATPGVKMLYLIRRRPTTSREELVMHWFANHMPIVIAGQKQAAEHGRLHAHRYVATLFQPAMDGTQPWDGIAQLWWDRAPPAPPAPLGATPTDTFQQKAEPYMPWATTEYVIMNGSQRLSDAPLTLNAPYPATRSGFCKLTSFVKVRPDTDFELFFAHWLTVHARNVASTMAAVGGFHYVINRSVAPRDESYAGVAELYFPDDGALMAFLQSLEPDGLERWLDPTGGMILTSNTEMIGIPT